jgi:type VI secretion system secreted protein VgrG
VTIGGAKTETIALAKAETIGLAKALTIGGAYQTTVGAAMNTTVALIQDEQVGLNKTVTVGDTYSLTAGGASNIKMDKDSITLKLGSSKIVVTSDAIYLAAKDIHIKAEGSVNADGPDDVYLNSGTAQAPPDKGAESSGEGG